MQTFDSSLFFCHVTFQCTLVTEVYFTIPFIWNVATWLAFAKEMLLDTVSRDLKCICTVWLSLLFPSDCHEKCVSQKATVPPGWAPERVRWSRSKPGQSPVYPANPSADFQIFEEQSKCLLLPASGLRTQFVSAAPSQWWQTNRAEQQVDCPTNL